MKRILIILAMALLWVSPALSDDTVGTNTHFDLGDGASIAVNPDGPGNGVSYTFSSGNTMNADGSWTLRFGNEGNSGIVVRTDPVFGSDD
jgi:hypothetical protein